MHAHPARIPAAQYERLKEIIAQRTGLVFPKRREEELRQVLAETARETVQGGDWTAFVAALAAEELSRPILRRLTARLTVGETYFFRNAPQFAVLRDEILPALVRARARTSRTLRFWSAGCSTGEEAYSLAILLAETIPNLAQWNIHLLATDINEEGLKTATAGLYREWSFREVPRAIRDRYFTAEKGAWRLGDQIRKMVTFRHLNLTEDTYPLQATGTTDMDLILCRNVMIYFTPALCQSITRRFWRALHRDGYLLVGHSEHDALVFPEFKKVIHPHTVVYRKFEPDGAPGRGLHLRFRGSGDLPSNVVPVLPPRPRPEPAAAAAAADRSAQREETRRFEAGAQAWADGDLARAREHFEAVVAENPANHRAHYLLALMAANRNRLDEAFESCRRALQQEPLSLEATYLMAVIARERGDTREELEHLKRTIYLNPDFILGHFHLGTCYQRQGNAAMAHKHFRNTLKLLASWQDHDYIEGTEGMTVGRLRESVARYCEPE